MATGGMSGVVNADEAGRCLQIARSALQAGNPEKAARFAEKAMKLYPSDEVSLLSAVFLSTNTAAPRCKRHSSQLKHADLVHRPAR